MSQRVQSQQELDWIAGFANEKMASRDLVSFEDALNKFGHPSNDSVMDTEETNRKITERFYPNNYQSENDISILDNPFEGYSMDDIIYSQHQIILKQKKEIAELRESLYAHNVSLNGNY